MKSVLAFGALAILTVSVMAPSAHAGSWEQTDGTYLALTRRGGIASALAHNHVIAIREPKIDVGPVASSPATGTFPWPEWVKLSFPVESLEVDDIAIANQVYPRLKEMGLYDSPFGELSESDRKSIRENMLAEDQLWSSKYPAIELEARSFRTLQEGEKGVFGTQTSDLTFNATHEADVTVTIRGKTVRKNFPLILTAAPIASQDQSDGADKSEVTLEGFLPVRFDEFGFEAYSALLGAIKNQDVFYFYFKVQGKWKP